LSQFSVVSATGFLVFTFAGEFGLKLASAIPDSGCPHAAPVWPNS
jgi:hypothetical protein